MDIATIIGLLALIPVGFFVYDRFFRVQHRVKIEHANVTLARLISEEGSRNERLALFIHDLKIVNSGRDAVTPESVSLEYLNTQGERLIANPYRIPVGTIEGFGESIAMTNGIDTIVVRWEDIDKVLSKRTVLNPGEICSGSVAFLLDVSLDVLRDLKEFTIVIQDFSGNKSYHRDHPQKSWYYSSEKGMTVVDAPIRKEGEKIKWEGVKLGVKKPD